MKTKLNLLTAGMLLAGLSTGFAPGLAMVPEFRYIMDVNPVTDKVYQLQSWSGK